MNLQAECNVDRPAPEFDPDGHVSTGAGEMVLCSGERYGKVIVYSAGGVRYERWDGLAWVAGS